MRFPVGAYKRNIIIICNVIDNICTMWYAVFNEPDGGSIRSAYEAVRFRQGIYGIWKKSGKLENEASVGLMTRSEGEDEG